MFDDDRNYYQDFVDAEYREVNNNSNSNTFIPNNSSNVDSIINDANAVFSYINKYAENDFDLEYIKK